MAPGHARNKLVAQGHAVYAHYLNRAQFASEIQKAAEAQVGEEREDVAALKERLRDARMLKRLRSLKLVLLSRSTQCSGCLLAVGVLVLTRYGAVQEVNVLSDDNAFVAPYTVQQFVSEVLRLSNIVIAPELVMISRPFSSPGTFNVPLAVLDDNGEQVFVALQLVPQQASVEQLKEAGITPSMTADL